MGAPWFEQWVQSNHIAKHIDLKYLKDCTVGVDAIHYLRNVPQEALLSALGGNPLTLMSNVIQAITDLQSAGIRLHFVFNGLDSGSEDDAPVSSVRAANLSNEAFNLYESKQPVEAERTFSASGVSAISSITECLKKTLYEHNVPFTVAPYSALAQLAYYEKHPSQFMDAIFGPSELFCFGVDKIITGLHVESSTVWWIDRRDCLREFGKISTHTFINAIMLSGSSLLPLFPPLSDSSSSRKQFGIRTIIDLLVSSDGSVARLCAQYPNDPSIKSGYLDQYKRAITGVKHHIIMTAEGDIEILDKQQAPDDVHDCIGLRLPEELYMYLSRGMIGARVLSWLTSGTISVTQPLAGGESKAYQDLVKTQLDPLRKQALKLLTEPVHRYYQSREMRIALWFDPSYEGKFNMKDISSDREALVKWNVKNDLIAEVGFRILIFSECLEADMGKFTEYFTAGTLQFAVLTLENADLAERTLTPKPKPGQEPIQHRNEILANTVWRFLQIRGYVNEKHQLTDWGETLKTALDASGSRRDQEEAIFLGVELLRLRLITPDTMFLGYAGAPEHGSDIDKRNCMLVSRLACLGKIRHEPKRWSGPLSRHLLAYRSIISNVHDSLRDLMEMILASMFLEGLVDRDRKDWADISLGLPFSRENSCALGIVTMHYLDDLCLSHFPTLIETREEARTKVQDRFQHTDLNSSLDDAFKIWDAFNYTSAIMARLLHFLLFALSANAASSVLDLIPNNFDKVVLQSNKPALVEFFAPWCGHCKKLAPVYEELAQNFDFAKDKVSIAKVDADAEKDLGRRFGVQGFPTLKWFDGKSDKPEDYNGGRDLESLSEFIVQKTGIKVKTKKAAPSAVEMLNDKTFKSQIGRDKDVLVAFTAPWCGHCKSLAPIWESVAQDYAAEPSVLIAKVDAEAENAKATAQEQDVKSYPTIKYFPKGSTTPEPYEGGRSEQDLLTFINEKAGTHRMIGGKLDKLGGTIPSLDSIVAKITGGESMESLSQELKDAAKGMKDKYAEYYVKVSDKISKNQGYVEKEMARLQGLIKKGGLAPEKLDDLISRSNILRKFNGEETFVEKEL
ncbi:hypothetical protein ACLMJK_000685 [Lecanora helva]